ncbi:MAG: thiamine pyrophosphate-dependent enzyme [Oscillospiraceae bacterium]
MNRYECMKRLAAKLKGDELFVISLGKMVDEWENAYPTVRTLNMGALGVECGTAIGLAAALPNRRIICHDSDGSQLLDLGCLAVLGNRQPKNLMVLVWDNESYDSLYTDPPLPTETRGNVDLAKMAEGAGVQHAITVRTLEEFESTVTEALAANELYYIVVKHDTSVPAESIRRRIQDGVEGKYQFLRYIEESEGIQIKPPCAVL